MPTASSRRPARARPGDRTEERVRMSKRRATIARRLVEAQHTAAMLTTFNEVDMSARDGAARAAQGSLHRSSTASASASRRSSSRPASARCKAFPQLNAEIQGDEIVCKHYYDIGMAVGAEAGLVVPVLRDADRMSFAEIEQAIRDFAASAQQTARSRSKTCSGGTFTITNGGVFGSLLSTPILNPPQVGILGLHKIEDRPVAVNGQVVIRPMMYVALSYDHRIVDGREAVQFLVGSRNSSRIRASCSSSCNRPGRARPKEGRDPLHGRLIGYGVAVMSPSSPWLGWECAGHPRARAANPVVACADANHRHRQAPDPLDRIREQTRARVGVSENLLRALDIPVLRVETRSDTVFKPDPNYWKDKADVEAMVRPTVNQWDYDSRR